MIPLRVTSWFQSRGSRSRSSLNRLRDAGVDAVLVGETLMRSADPEAALRTLRGDRAGVAPERVARQAVCGAGSIAVR